MSLPTTAALARWPVSKMHSPGNFQVDNRLGPLWQSEWGQRGTCLGVFWLGAICGHVNGVAGGGLVCSGNLLGWHLAGDIQMLWLRMRGAWVG